MQIWLLVFWCALVALCYLAEGASLGPGAAMSIPGRRRVRLTGTPRLDAGETERRRLRLTAATRPHAIAGRRRL